MLFEVTEFGRNVGPIVWLNLGNPSKIFDITGSFYRNTHVNRQVHKIYLFKKNTLIEGSR